MSNNLGNKQTMAKNIKYYMELKGVSAADMCSVLNVPQSTFSYWTNAKSYPRIDKIEMMAQYFGIRKSDLVEEHELRPSQQDLPPEVIPADMPEVIMIARAGRKMSPERRADMIKMLKIAFPDAFKDIDE